MGGRAGGGEGPLGRPGRAPAGSHHSARSPSQAPDGTGPAGVSAHRAVSPPLGVSWLKVT